MATHVAGSFMQSYKQSVHTVFSLRVKGIDMEDVAGADECYLTLHIEMNIY